MPHVNGSSDGDDLGDADEIKVFKHDEECEEEKKLIAEERQSDSLTEDKSSLVTEGESQSKNTSLAGQSFTGKNALRPEPGPLFGGRSLESLTSPHASPLNMGYIMPYPPYHNGMAAALSSVSMSNKMGLSSAHHAAAAAAAAASSFQFLYQGGDHHHHHHLGQPPPAHMGIPPYQLDPKTAGAMGLPRPPMYSFAPTQYPYPILSPEMAQMTSWHSPGGMYPISNAAAAFRSPYPAGLQLPSTSLPRFSPSLLPHPGLHGGHPLMSPGHAAALSSLHHGVKQESGLSMGLGIGEQNHSRGGHHDAKAASSSATQQDGTARSTSQPTPPNNNNTSQSEKKKPHIKKPLNAFMLYMKEMRAKVVAECTLKESAAINQILGRRWHTLSREEQSRYYEMARQQRQLHMQLYPNWTMRDSVASGAARKRRNKRDKAADGEGNNMKKCRARYGLDQQSQWCKPCRRKKKCIRYMDGADEADHSEDNLGSAGSVGETRSPDSKVDDDDDGASSDSEVVGEDDDGGATSASDLGLSSPGLSLSSLASPAILPSPSTSLASPCPLTPSPATPSSASYSTSNHHDIMAKVTAASSSIITAQASLSAASSSSSSSSSSSGNGSLPFGLYNMLPGPSPSGSSSGHHPHHPHHPAHPHATHQHHLHHHHGLLMPPALPHRHPIGTNPHDINNPLSVNQLTGQCSTNNKDKASSVSKASDTNSHAIVSVT